MIEDLFALTTAALFPTPAIPQAAPLPWYALRVRTKSEPLVGSFLAQRGLEAFVPTYEVRRRYSDRIKKSTEALFPGYVFCRFDAREPLPVITTPAVQSVVGFGAGPEPISEQEIEKIRRVVTVGRGVAPATYLSAGQRVRVRCGPLTGVEGYLVSFHRQHTHQLVICADLLQRAISLEIDAADIEPL